MKKEYRLALIIVVGIVASSLVYSKVLSNSKQGTGYNSAKIQEMKYEGYDVDAAKREAKRKELDRQYREYAD